MWHDCKEAEGWALVPTAAHRAADLTITACLLAAGDAGVGGRKALQGLRAAVRLGIAGRDAALALLDAQLCEGAADLPVPRIAHRRI